ncbi:MAG: hypothetical protein AAF684_02700, partial [Pseudomonadota bacterium]
MSGLVVISDTDPLDLQRRAASLENAGVRVAARAHGEPLVSLLTNAMNGAPPDAVILGACVESLDADICTSVRQAVKSPVVVVTKRTTASVGAVERALRAGADDVLLAPSPTMLNRRIAMWRKAELRNALDERREAALANAAILQVGGMLTAEDANAIVVGDLDDTDDPLAAMLAETSVELPETSAEAKPAIAPATPAPKAKKAATPPASPLAAAKPKPAAPKPAAKAA